MPPELPEAARARLSSLLAWLSRRKQQRSPHVRRLLLVAAAAIFVGTTAYAVRELGGVPLAEGWPAWALLTAVLSLVAYVVNAAEFALSARLLGVRPSPSEALKVSILGSAANVLPIPGAALVRASALKRMGLTLRAALSMTTVIGLVWVATGCLVAGALLLPAGEPAVGGVALLAGAGALAVGGVLLVVQLGPSAAGRGFVQIAGVELVSVATAVVRLWVVLHALGADVALADAAALAAVAIVASAAGLFPGGLGLREALSYAVAAAVGITGALGALAATFDRVVAYVVLAACSGLVLAIASRRGPADTAAPADDLAETATVPAPDPDTDKVPR